MRALILFILVGGGSALRGEIFLGTVDYRGPAKDFVLDSSRKSIPALLVYGRKAGAYQVKTNSGLVWISGGRLGAFHSYEQDLVHRPMVSVSNCRKVGWLWAAPAGRVRLEFPAKELWAPVRVTGRRKIKGDLWLAVEVLEKPACATKARVEAAASGWIPAHFHDGTPTLAWRECD